MKSRPASTRIAAIMIRVRHLPREAISLLLLLWARAGHERDQARRGAPSGASCGLGTPGGRPRRCGTLPSSSLAATAREEAGTQEPAGSCAADPLSQSLGTRSGGGSVAVLTCSATRLERIRVPS
jgi:hypothetical protein